MLQPGTVIRIKPNIQVRNAKDYIGKVCAVNSVVASTNPVMYTLTINAANGMPLLATEDELEVI